MKKRVVVRVTDVVGSMVIAAFLRAGIDVCSTAMTPWVWPQMTQLPAGWRDPITETCATPEVVGAPGARSARRSMRGGHAGARRTAARRRR